MTPHGGRSDAQSFADALGRAPCGKRGDDLELSGGEEREPIQRQLGLLGRESPIRLGRARELRCDLGDPSRQLAPCIDGELIPPGGERRGQGQEFP